MATEMEMQKAVEMYNIVCQALDERNWRYKKDEELLKVTFGVSGDDLSMDFLIFIDAERQLIRLCSYLPFKIEQKPVEMSIAVSCANYYLVNGCFDYDFAKGLISFRMTTAYHDSLIGTGLIAYMIDCACQTVDDYNDKFLMVEKGKMQPFEVTQ